MKELLKQWHALLHACLVERGATWKQHDKYAARNYSFKAAGGCYIFDPSADTEKKVRATIQNYLDINAFLTVGNTAPLSVNHLPIIWASVIELGEIESLVTINSNHELYHAFLEETIEFVQTGNPIIVSFVLKQLFKK